MDSTALQRELFQQIKALVPNNISFVDAIADLLCISTDSAYRRIRAEKSISLEEIQKLATHFHISIDALLSINSSSTVFYGTWLNRNPFSLQQYLTTILNMTASISKGDQKAIYYEAKDFPPFHYFHIPELAAFKYFFWARTILNDPTYSKTLFEEWELAETLKQTGKDILTAYNKIPSIEIWSSDTINSTIRQIDYYRELGNFRDDKTPERLFLQLEQLVEHIKEQTEHGEKFMIGQKPYGGPKLKIYYNEAYLGHNTILTEVDGCETVYINHGVLNLMFTHDAAFCEQSRWYLENIMRKSALISQVNDIERNRFFNRMFEKIQRAQEQKNKNLNI